MFSTAAARGREIVHKRYLVHVAGYNLGFLMRAPFGAGTPREAAAAWNAFLFVVQAADAIVVVVTAACDDCSARHHCRARRRLIKSRLLHRAAKQSPRRNTAYPANVPTASESALIMPCLPAQGKGRGSGER
jgi:hypothetical protein